MAPLYRGDETMKQPLVPIPAGPRLRDRGLAEDGMGIHSRHEQID